MTEISPKDVLESMIDSATQDWLIAAKAEMESDFEDAMDSVARAYAQGYKHGLEMSYRSQYGNFYDSKVLGDE